jgi:hypothetical protein
MERFSSYKLEPRRHFSHFDLGRIVEKRKRLEPRSARIGFATIGEGTVSLLLTATSDVSYVCCVCHSTTLAKARDTLGVGEWFARLGTMNGVNRCRRANCWNRSFCNRGHPAPNTALCCTACIGEWDWMI